MTAQDEFLANIKEWCSCELNAQQVAALFPKGDMEKWCKKNGVTVKENINGGFGFWDGIKLLEIEEEAKEEERLLNRIKQNNMERVLPAGTEPP